MSINIKVAVKVRPLISQEIKKKMEEQWKVIGNSIQSINVQHSNNSFNFDHIFGQTSHNSDVYNTIADPIVHMCLNGFNGTIFAYGQTSSGKTHTMMGNDDEPGIIIMAIRRLFQGNDSGRKFMIRIGYVEIYNEKVYDLLHERAAVTVNQSGDTDVNLSHKEVVVSNDKSVIEILHRGNILRKAACTKMNQQSSRSHAIFRLVIESKDESGTDEAVNVSYLNLVDLAGSERADDAGTSGSRLKEGGHINKSLLFLSQVIKSLSEGDKFINYRNSVLTRILQASLGGNANTAIVCNITPAAIDETASTLNFASQAKNVRNEPVCNKVYSDEALMNNMQKEIDELKAKLEKKELEDTKKCEERLAEIKAMFLTFARPKNNRRQTWHHGPGADFDPIVLTPLTEVLENDVSFVLHTPQILKPSKQFFSPTPDRHNVGKKIGHVDQEYKELRQFTHLERKLECTKESDRIKYLEEQLRMAKEQLDVKSNDQWNLVHQKLNNEFICSHCSEMKNTSNSNGMNGLTEEHSNGIKSDDDQVAAQIQLKELEDIKEDNERLTKQLEQLLAEHENEKRLSEQKINAANFAQEKAEVLQAEHEITFNQYKNQTSRRINELISQVEELKIQLNNRSSQKVDLNISKIPIKVETTNSALKMTELQYDLDQLRETDEENKTIIRDLESKLQSILEEKNILQIEHSEMSTQIMDFIEDVELLKSKLANMEAEREEINKKCLIDFRELEELRESTEKNSDLLTKRMESLTCIQDENVELKAKITAYIENVELLASKLVKVEAEREEINQKNVELEALRTSNESNAESLNEQKEYLSRLDNENLELKTKITEYIENIELLTSKLVDMEAEREEINQKILTDIEELEVLRKSNERNTELLTKQNESLSRLDNENIELKAQLSEMTTTKEQVEEECGNHEAKLCEVIKEVTHLKEKNDFLSNKLIVLEPLKAKNDILCSSVEKLEADNAKLVQQVGEMTSKYDLLGESMEASKVDLISKIESMERSEQSYQIRLNDADSKLIEVTASYETAKETIVELENKIQNIKSDMLDVQANDAETTSYAALEGKYADLQKNYDASRADVEKLESIIDNYLQVIEKTEGECKTITASLLESYEKIKVSMELTESLNVKNIVLNEEVSNLKNLLDTQSAELDDVTKKMEVIQQLASATVEGDANLKDQLQKLQEKHRSEIVEKENELQKVSSEFQAEIVQLKSDLQEKEQLFKNTSEELRHEISKLESVLRVKDEQSTSCETELSQLRSDLQEMERKSIFLEEKMSKLTSELQEKDEHSVELTTEISKMKVEWIEKELVHKNKSNELTDEIAKLEAELRDNEHLLKITSDELSGEIAKLETELRDNKQHCKILSKDLSDEIANLKTELSQKEESKVNSEAAISQLKSELHEKETFLKDTSKTLNDEIADLKSKLVDKEEHAGNSEIEIIKLKTEWQDKEKVLKDTVNDLKDEMILLKNNLHEKNQVSAAFNNEISILKTKLVDKDQQLADLEKEISALKSNLCDKEKQTGGFEATISKLKLESREKEKEISGWKSEITRLEKQLRPTNEKRRDSDDKKDLKDIVTIERKSKRYSQHDESRYPLNETIAPPKNVAIQTVPSDASCSCEKMNNKIQELTTTVRLKEARIHTLKLEMRNHPLIGENQDLKKKLDDRLLDLRVQQMNADHYKAKVQQMQMARDVRHREVQVELNQVVKVESPSDTIPIEQNAALLGPVNFYRINVMPEKYQRAKLEIKKLQKALVDKTLMLEKKGDQHLSNGTSPVVSSSNGHQHLTNGTSPVVASSNGDVNSENTTTEMEGQSEEDIIRLKDKEIQRLSKEKTEISKKTTLYRELAVSRRAEVKRLEAEIKTLKGSQNNL